MDRQIDLQCEFGRSLEHALSRYRKEVRRASKDLTPDRVHDLRIASRRLMAALNGVHCLLRDEKADRIRKDIKSGLRKLGPLRDLQVQAELAQAELRSSGAVEKFIGKLETKEKQLKRQAVAEIARIETRTFAKPIMAFKRRVSRPLRDIDPDHFLFTLNSIVDATFASVVDRNRVLNLQNPQTFHRLRVRFKSFRYLLEFVQPVLRIPQDDIERMKRYQDALGEIHDLMVLIERLERYFKGQEMRQPGEFADLRKLKGRLDTRLRIFMADDAATIFDFWRSLPMRVSTDALRAR